MKKNLVENDIKKMKSLMKYDKGLTLSENKQLNEISLITSVATETAKSLRDSGASVIDYLSGNQGFIPDFLQKGSQSLMKDVQQAHKTPDSLTTNNLLDYIGYRTKEMTEKELPQNFLEVIAHTLCYKSTNQKQCDPKKWRNKPQLLDYTDYQKASGGKADGGFWEGIVNSPEVYSDIQTALGSSTVRNGEGYWIVTDNYDFDNIRRIHQDGEDRKKVYDSLWNMPWDTLKSTWNVVAGPWNKENLAKYAERILAWQHSSGYKGFPIKLKIPKSGCKFCN
tara:strand:+ start:368 stop:1207 length:840 start_codon:yes stop_codon:yes gene_type:complete